MPADPQQRSGVACSRSSTPGNRLEDGARGFADALRVGEVAGVLHGHGSLDPPELVREVRFGDVFEDVVGRGREAFGSLCPRVVVAQQASVLLHRCAATGGVDDHRLDLGGLEGRDIAPGEGTSGIRVAGVRVERAAAALLRWRNDLGPRVSEHAHRRLVHARVELAVDAAEQQRNTRRGRVGAGRCRQRAGLAVGGVAERRRCRLEATKPFGERATERASDQRLQSRTRVEPAEPKRETQPSRPRQDIAQQPRAPRPGARRRLGRGEQRGAGVLHDPPVRHGRRTCRLAGAALETEVEMAQCAVAGLDTAVEQRGDQVQAAPRRLQLLPGREVSRTGGEAEAAVDAVVQIVPRGDVGTGESDRDGFGWGAHRPSPQRPGLITR